MSLALQPVSGVVGHRLPRVLVLSRNYPNEVLNLLGIWVQQTVRATLEICEPTVVSPVPFAPRIPFLPEYYRRFAAVGRERVDEGVEVFHPRFVIGPGSSTAALEPRLYHAGVRRTVTELHDKVGFDLIHAHFAYPDGVVATRLGRKLGIPVVITEQAPWRPWLDTNVRARRGAVQAVLDSAAVIAISSAVRDTISHFVGPGREIDVIPDPVDGAMFDLPPDGTAREQTRLLFVGNVRHVKGLDVLIGALRLLSNRGRDVELVVVGEGHYRSNQLQQEQLVRETERLGLSDRITFVGKKSLPALVEYMQRSALLVLPSRAESLGMVLVEALACGTPVVATRCGGPEDIVDENVGLLVPTEDVEALADGIAHVLDNGAAYDPASLRAYALSRFGARVVADRIAEVYTRVLQGAP